MKFNINKLNNKFKCKNSKQMLFRIISVILVGVIIACIAFSVNTAEKKKITFDFNGKVASGIDVSYHNGEIDWKIVSENVDFAFIRLGYRGYTNGTLSLDKKYKKNIKSANKNGVPVGVYFFSQAVNPEEAIEEAKFVLNAVKDYDISLPIAIDFEYATWKNNTETGRLKQAGLTRKESTDVINAFCEEVEKVGYKPAVYASAYFYNTLIDTLSLTKSAYIWVADYHEKITYSGKYDIWQYSSKGKLKGVSSQYVDLNYWYVK